MASWLDNFEKKCDTLFDEKDSLFYRRPWYYKMPMMAAGLTSVGIGSAITLGTFGLGTPIGATLIGTGALLVGRYAASSEGVQKRHTLFDIAQELEEQKEDGQKKHLQKGKVFGNLVPYLQTYNPFSGARGYLHEVEKVYDFAKNNPHSTSTQHVPGVDDGIVALFKKQYSAETSNSQNHSDKNTSNTVSRAATQEKSSSSIPGTSPLATMCRKLSAPLRWMRGSKVEVGDDGRSGRS